MWTYENENGCYEADCLIVLLWQIFKHRTWHLFRGDGWID